jgi:hypothetical protein
MTPEERNLHDLITKGLAAGKKLEAAAAAHSAAWQNLSHDKTEQNWAA